MPLALRPFANLSLTEQILVLRQEGTFLAAQGEKDQGILLYQLAGGFFCEVYYYPEQNAVRHTRCFTNNGPLAAYYPAATSTVG
jgi:hypothetical protein